MNYHKTISYSLPTINQYLSTHETKTKHFAAQLAQALVTASILPCTILLEGEFAVGKTCFTQGFAHGLAITERIISPSFSIITSYETDICSMHHIDLYRITTQNTLWELDLPTYIHDHNAITLIEWPYCAYNLLQNISALLLIKIIIDTHTTSTRIMTFHTQNTEITALIANLINSL